MEEIDNGYENERWQKNTERMSSSSWWYMHKILVLKIHRHTHTRTSVMVKLNEREY